jgi:ABC-type nitrate/sulfonate/bicarbonate transport system substrate-binding protein
MSITRRDLLTRGLAAGTALTIPSVVAGCEASPKPAHKKRKLRFTPGYVGAREYAIYVGKQLGFFAKRGIDLVINAPGGPAVSVSSILGGDADMASADYATIAQTLAPPPSTRLKAQNGAKAVAVINRQMMFALFSYAKSNITSPADLAGKTIGCATGSAVQRLWLTYCGRAGINPAATRFYTLPASQTNTLLISGHADLFGTYVTDRASVAKYAGGPQKPLNDQPLLYSQYLTDPYGTLLIASEKLCDDEDAPFVRAACDAVRESIAYCLKNPAGAAGLLAKEVPTQTVAISAAVYTDMRNYISLTPAFDYQHMIRALSVLKGAGMISQDVRPENLIYNVYPGRVDTA